MHGLSVIGAMDIDWHTLCEELLGIRLTKTDICGAYIRTFHWYPFLTLTSGGF